MQFLFDPPYVGVKCRESQGLGDPDSVAGFLREHYELRFVKVNIWSTFLCPVSNQTQRFIHFGKSTKRIGLYMLVIEYLENFIFYNSSLSNRENWFISQLLSAYEPSSRWRTVRFRKDFLHQWSPPLHKRLSTHFFIRSPEFPFLSESTKSLKCRG